MRATAVLKEKGISVQHMHVSTLKPFTDPTIVEAIKKSKYGVVTIKNHLDIGGLGSAVADVIAENGLGKRLVKIGLPGYPHGASQMYLMKKYGIDAMHLVSAVEDLTGKKLGVARPIGSPHFSPRYAITTAPHTSAISPISPSRMQGCVKRLRS